MKLDPLTNLDKRNKTTSKKKKDNDVVSTNFDIIVAFMIYNNMIYNS